MRVEDELPVATQHDRTPPSCGEQSLPVKGPMNDILAQRMVKDVLQNGEIHVRTQKNQKIFPYQNRISPM